MTLTPLQRNNLSACLNRAEQKLIQGSDLRFAAALRYRQTQLERMNRDQLRLEAAKHGIPKPDGGWIDVIPHILEFEGLRRVVPNPPGSVCPCVPPEQQIGTASRNFEQASRQTAASAQWQRTPGWRFTTEYYKAIGLPTCIKCGEQAPRRNAVGPICAIASPATCPVINSQYQYNCHG